MNGTATAVASNVDLDSVISSRLAEVDQLKALKQRRDEIDSQILVIVRGEVTTGKPLQQMQQIEAAAEMGRPIHNGKGMGDLLAEHLGRELKAKRDFALSARDATNFIEQSGYPSRSKNLYNVVRQCLVTDKRFKSRKAERGKRDVVFTLADH